MADSTPNRTPNRSPHRTPTRDNRSRTPVRTPARFQNLFSSLKEAEESVHHVIPVDIEMPKSHGHGVAVFYFQESLLVSGIEGTVLDDKLRFQLEGIADLRDFKEYRAYLVCGGQALYFTKPSIPNYLKENADELYALEAPETDEELTLLDKEFKEIKKWRTQVAQDPDRRTTSHLFVFPEGMVCTTDVSSVWPAIPSRDMRVHLQMRELAVDYTLTSNKRNSAPVETGQIFHPAFYSVCVVSEEPNELEYQEEEDQDICESMQGMKFDGN